MSVSLNVTTTNNDQVRFNKIVLKNDGSNFIAWKTIIPVYLQSQPYAWEVIQGDLNPLVEAEKTKYETGNKNARDVLFSTLRETTLTRVFSRDSHCVTAKDTYDRIILNYQPNNPIFADIAIDKFMSFTWNSAISVLDNLTIFQKLVDTCEETEAGLTVKCLTARLVNALPESWDSFKSGWGTKDLSQKTMQNLTEMITAEDARRKMNEKQNDTALTARFGGKRRNHGSCNTQTTSTSKNSSSKCDE